MTLPIITPLTPADLDDIMPLERRAFKDPWTRQMYYVDLTENFMATYLALRPDPHYRQCRRRLRGLRVYLGCAAGSSRRRPLPGQGPGAEPRGVGRPARPRSRAERPLRASGANTTVNPVSLHDAVDGSLHHAR